MLRGPGGEEASRCNRNGVNGEVEVRVDGFKARKAAQVAAFFAKAQGGTINVLKLVKLIYLADREFLNRYDATITNDRFVSMDHGPVNSMTLDYIDGCKLERDAWDVFITDRADYELGLVNPNLAIEDLDELSEAEIEVLEETWMTFGKMTKYQIRDYTHKNCPEWEDPKGSSAPIPFERILKFLGKEHSSSLANRIESERALDAVFAAV
jgi:uncharacterized phage-associated protein